MRTSSRLACTAGDRRTLPPRGGVGEVCMWFWTQGGRMRHRHPEPLSWVGSCRAAEAHRPSSWPRRATEISSARRIRACEANASLRFVLRWVPESMRPPAHHCSRARWRSQLTCWRSVDVCVFCALLCLIDACGISLIGFCEPTERCMERERAPPPPLIHEMGRGLPQPTLPAFRR